MWPNVPTEIMEEGDKFVGEILIEQELLNFFKACIYILRTFQMVLTCFLEKKRKGSCDFHFAINPGIQTIQLLHGMGVVGL